MFAVDAASRSGQDARPGTGRSITSKRINMEEMTEVELDGKKYVWDGGNWCDARTYMEPPETVLNRLNDLYRKHEILAAARAPAAPRARSPRRSAAAARFVPAKSLQPP